MALPISTLPTKDVTVNGSPVTIRSLNRPEVIKVAALAGDTEAIEILMLIGATGSSTEEVAAFRESNDARTVDNLIGEISRLSGIGDMTPLKCPACGHADDPAAFVQRDEAGDPKAPASSSSSSEPS